MKILKNKIQNIDCILCMIAEMNHNKTLNSNVWQHNYQLKAEN